MVQYRYFSESSNDVNDASGKSLHCELCPRKFESCRERNFHVANHSQMIHRCTVDNSGWLFRNPEELQEHARDTHAHTTSVEPAVEAEEPHQTGHVDMQNVDGALVGDTSCAQSPQESFNNLRLQLEGYESSESHETARREVTENVSITVNTTVDPDDTLLGSDGDREQHTDDHANRSGLRTAEKETNNKANNNNQNEIAKCRTCNRSFYTEGSRDQHESDHHKMKYACVRSQCGYAYKKFRRLKQHCQKNHNLKLTSEDKKKFRIQAETPQLTVSSSQKDGSAEIVALNPVSKASVPISNHKAADETSSDDPKSCSETTDGEKDIARAETDLQTISDIQRTVGDPESADTPRQCDDTVRDTVDSKTSQSTQESTTITVTAEVHFSSRRSNEDDPETATASVTADEIKDSLDTCAADEDKQRETASIIQAQTGSSLSPGENVERSSLNHADTKTDDDQEAVAVDPEPRPDVASCEPDGSDLLGTGTAAASLVDSTFVPSGEVLLQDTLGRSEMHRDSDVDDGPFSGETDSPGKTDQRKTSPPKQVTNFDNEKAKEDSSTTQNGENQSSAAEGENPNVESTSEKKPTGSDHGRTLRSGSFSASRASEKRKSTTQARTVSADITSTDDRDFPVPEAKKTAERKSRPRTRPSAPRLWTPRLP